MVLEALEKGVFPSALEVIIENKNMSSNNSGTAFSTVLVARKVDVAPSELEIKLRCNSSKLKVIPSLPSGANILLPDSDATVAVRIYDAHLIEKMEIEHASQIRKSVQNQVNNFFRKKNDNGYNDQFGNKRRCDDENLDQSHGYGDFDGICSFRDSFRHSVVCFILSNDELFSSQLGRYDSVVNTLQRCLSDTSTTREKRGNSRIFLVQNIESALQALAGTVKSLGRDKSSQKANYFRAEAERKFLPDPNTGIIKSEQAASLHVSNAFRLWSERMEIPVDDANVLMNVLGSLEKIMTADENTLENIPIDSSTKSKILHFFSNTTMKNYGNVDMQHFESQNYNNKEWIHDMSMSKDSDMNGSTSVHFSNNFDAQRQVEQYQHEIHYQPIRVQGISGVFQQRAMINNVISHGLKPVSYHNQNYSSQHIPHFSQNPAIMSQPMNNFSQNYTMISKPSNKFSDNGAMMTRPSTNNINFGQNSTIMRMRVPNPVHHHVYKKNSTPVHLMNPNYHQQQLAYNVGKNSIQSHLEWNNDSDNYFNGQRY